MKSAYHLLFIGLAFFLFATNSCKKEESYMNNAIITGYDIRACVCCGGLMITFSGETRPYTGEFRLIENSSDLGITERDKFPLYVKVDWKPDTTNICNHIIITRFARR